MGKDGVFPHTVIPKTNRHGKSDWCQYVL